MPSLKSWKLLPGLAPEWMKKPEKLSSMGGRIRACLKQPELAPVPVLEQVAVLVALTAKLFDNIPLDQMADAELAVRQAMRGLDAGIYSRLKTAGNLSDTDRDSTLQAAREALDAFRTGSCTSASISRFGICGNIRVRGNPRRSSTTRIPLLNHFRSWTSVAPVPLSPLTA